MLRPSLIPRPRLVEKLQAGLGRVDRPSAWLSLGNEENAPGLFLTYLIVAAHQIDEGVGKTIASLLQSWYRYHQKRTLEK